MAQGKKRLALPTRSEDIDRTFDELVRKKHEGEEGADTALMEALAADVYLRPRLYGFRSDEDVGEAFVRYWTRIGGLADRYEDTGRCFRAYAMATIRYMALSLRRSRAAQCDLDESYRREAEAELLAEAGSYERYRTHWTRLSLAPCFPTPDDSSDVAVATRRRILFLFVKCALLLDDATALRMAAVSGLDERLVLSSLRLARQSGYGQRERRRSRQRGRDSAWMRMCARERRLARESDAVARASLAAKIERDRRLYRRAVRHIEASPPIITNKAVAFLLGVPKGTVDCGIVRLAKALSELTEEGQTR